MTDPVSPRRGPFGLRAHALPAAALILALAALATLPALAMARRAARHSPRCRSAHARLGRVPRGETERATLCLLNLQRTERGLPRLRESSDLVRSAQRWTNTMVRERAFSHGTDFGARISAAGFNWSQIGENIADGYRTPSSVVRAWMRSRGHCENVLSPQFREAGAGFDHRSAAGGHWRSGTWTLDFALRMGQRAASGNWTPAEHCPY